MVYIGPNILNNASGSKARTSSTLPDVSSFVPSRTPTPAGFNFTREKVQSLFPVLSLKELRESYQKSLDDLKTRREKLQIEEKRLEKIITSLKNATPVPALALANAEKQLVAVRESITASRRAEARLRQQLRETPTKNDPPPTQQDTKSGGTTGKTTKPPTDTSADINLSACKELYFRGTERFMFDNKDINNNAPGFVPSLSSLASAKNAEELWRRGVATKGRIQTFSPFIGNKNPGTLGGRKLEDFASEKSLGTKSFQFHYNPGSVDMAYGSVNDVDLGYLASGQAVTNFLQALGQVSFEILLNRMPDMKYILPPNREATPEQRERATYIKPGINYSRDVYDREPRTASNQNNELKDIYNKGTMYDLEFLLKVLMGGVSFKSLLRGGEITSDLGFAIPQPVELHLGNRLRYVISVTRLQVRHVIFNERMVPLFSTVSIEANRVPADTVAVTNLDLGGGAASSSTDIFSPGTNPTVNAHLRDLQGQ